MAQGLTAPLRPPRKREGGPELLAILSAPRAPPVLPVLLNRLAQLEYRRLLDETTAVIAAGNWWGQKLLIGCFVCEPFTLKCVQSTHCSESAELSLRIFHSASRCLENFLHVHWLKIVCSILPHFSGMSFLPDQLLTSLACVAATEPGADPRKLPSLTNWKPWKGHGNPF